jgi:hypothetical protein
MVGVDLSEFQKNVFGRRFADLIKRAFPSSQGRGWGAEKDPGKTKSNGPFVKILHPS